MGCGASSSTPHAAAGTGTAAGVTAEGPAAVGVEDGKICLGRDDHTETDQQVKLAADLPRFAGAPLWFEAIRPYAMTKGGS